MSESYPVMLDLAGRRCVVVGGGPVAARKIHGLLHAGAQVTVISPHLIPEIADMGDAVNWCNELYTCEVLAQVQPFLVFACTDQPTVNQQIAVDARSLGVLVNVTDRSAASDFSNMETLRRPPLTISIHSGGTSPALVKHLTAHIAAAVGPEYPLLARWLGNLRVTPLMQTHSQNQRQQLYETLIASDVLDLLREQQTEQAYARFQNLIDTWAANR